MTLQSIPVYLVLGLVGAALYVAVGWRRPLGWWAAGLAVAAGVYVAFALARGAWAEAGVEVLGVLLYGGVAAIGGRRRARWMVAAGWARHPLWDLGVHLQTSVLMPARGEVVAVGLGLGAPEWYVWACLSFDLVVGAVLLLGASRPSSRASVS